MSGLETEEPILQPGRIDVLLGQGQTAQVLRNLCLMVAKDSPEDWQRIAALMQRLFGVVLGAPQETPRGAIELQYRQAGMKTALDLSAAGRGFQQLLLIFAYLYSHKGSVLLVAGADPRALPAEVGEKLGRLQRLFEAARPIEPMGDADIGPVQE